MKKPFGGIVLDTAFRLIVPFSLVYGVYVLIFGEARRRVPGGRAAVDRCGFIQTDHGRSGIVQYFDKKFAGPGRRRYFYLCGNRLAGTAQRR